MTDSVQMTEVTFETIKGNYRIRVAYYLVPNKLGGYKKSFYGSVCNKDKKFRESIKTWPWKSIVYLNEYQDSCSLTSTITKDKLEADIEFVYNEAIRKEKSRQQRSEELKR